MRARVCCQLLSVGWSVCLYCLTEGHQPATYSPCFARIVCHNNNTRSAGRLGINQCKSASARRERAAWAGAAEGLEDTFGADEANRTTIDGLALFDDAIFWTEVQLETPYSGGHAADLTNYSTRNGSVSKRNSGSQHRTTAVYGSQHGGSRHLTYADNPHGSKHGAGGGADVVSGKDVASAARSGTAGGAARSGPNNPGLYSAASNGQQVSPAAAGAKAAAAGDQAV